MTHYSYFAIYIFTSVQGVTHLYRYRVSHIYMGTEWQIMMMAIQDTKMFMNIVSGKSVM